jgi:hypothetical protein
MRRMRHAPGAVVILASLLTFSCNNSYGIFEDVQGQTEQDGSDVFKKTATVTAFRLGDSYYASTSKLYRRSVDGSHWSQVSIGGTHSYFLRSVVLVGNSTIFALVGDKASDVKLFSSSGGAWSRVNGLPSSIDFDSLFSANDCIFAVSHRFVSKESTETGTSYYSLYYSSDSGNSFNSVSKFIDLKNKTIRGVVYGGGYYYFAAEDRLYKCATPDNSTETSLGKPPHRIWRISYTGTASGTKEHLYIGAVNGNLYRDDFSGYEDVASSPLTAVIEVPTSNDKRILLVGTDAEDTNTPANGYYEGVYTSLQHGPQNAIVAHSSSIYNSTVNDAPVHDLYWDSASNDLFICISPGSSNSTFYGLYRSHFDGKNWDGWEAE